MKGGEKMISYRNDSITMLTLTLYKNGREDKIILPPRFRVLVDEDERVEVREKVICEGEGSHRVLMRV